MLPTLARSASARLRTVVGAQPAAAASTTAASAVGGAAAAGAGRGDGAAAAGVSVDLIEGKDELAALLESERSRRRLAELRHQDSLQEIDRLR